jgi:riboflavin biosynthesis pyrimidine reductase
VTPSFTTWFDDAAGATLDLPEPIADAYGRLALPDRLVYANFVSSLDGIAALDDVQASSRVIGMGNPADRFLMGLLRACAEVVVIGAGTFREHKGPWTAEQTWPDGGDDWAELRKRLGLPPYPELVVVSTSGSVNKEADVVRSVEELTERISGYNRVLTEGGPHLMADLLAAGMVDELFLTISPLVLGSLTGRPGFAAGVDLEGTTARLLSARGSGSHVFLRYAIDKGREA